jgi:hypothetical protein
MRKDEQIKIMYASKYAGIQNSYKKWQGEVLGLVSTGALDKKRSYEKIFQQRVNANPAWKTAYGNLLSDLAAEYQELRPFGYARDYYTEIISKIELFTVASQLNTLITAYEKDGEKGFQQRLPLVKSALTDLYAEYSPEVDRNLFVVLMEMYWNDQEKQYVSPAIKWAIDQKLSFTQFAGHFYDEPNSLSKKETIALLSKPASALIAELKENKGVRLYRDLLATYQQEVSSKLNNIQNRINQLQRTYMQAQMDVFKEKTFYPDANSTLRVTYGQVKGYAPRDAVSFDYYTYLDGVMEKYKPGDYEFDVPEKLKTLYQNKDYGQYGSNGKMPVCFLASNHTTGGNSGSPALDAYGNLVGLNFDRVWEGTMSDINYDPTLCRNIMVDIRYVLFIVDKYAGASHLVGEMKLVHPKRGK